MRLQRGTCALVRVAGVIPKEDLHMKGSAQSRGNINVGLHQTELKAQKPDFGSGSNLSVLEFTSGKGGVVILPRYNEAQRALNEARVS